jgi:hypothetical protein
MVKNYITKYLKIISIAVFIGVISNYALATQNKQILYTDQEEISEDIDATDSSIKDMFTDSYGNPLETEKIPSLKEKIGRWSILTSTIDGKKACYAISKPFAKVGNHKEVREAYLMVIYWNRKKQDINISLGFTIKASTKPTISVDGKQFTAHTNGSIAIPAEGVDADMIKNMLYANKLLIKAESRVFTYVVDAYNLEDFKTIYGKLVELCDYM